jgi:hypothetical protein
MTTDRTQPETGLEAAWRAVPDVFLNDSHLAAARAVLHRVTGGSGVLLAFVSGSLAAGLGHGLSDVDLYVSATGSPPEMRSYREGGYIVQVNPVPARYIDLIARACTEYTDTAASRPQISLTEWELTGVLRYAIGTVLADAGTGLPSTEDSVRTIRRVIMNRNAYRLGDLAEDTLGTLEVGDTLTALQTSLMAVEHGLDCALAGAGDLYLGRKFQLRRAARTAALHDLLPDLWACLRQPQSPPDHAGATEIAVRRMLLATHLISAALLDGWDKPLDRVPAFTDRRGEGGPVRSPWVTPVRFCDSWGMAGPDTGYRVTEAMVRLWRCLDGRAASPLHDRLADDPALGTISLPRLDAAISMLVEKKAAVPDSGSLG